MDNKEKVRNLIRKNRIGMFTTESQKGKLVSRPIAFTDMDDDNRIWFFTDLTSEKIEDIKNNQEVNFSFSNEGKSEYVSMSGTAEIVKDQDLIDEKWTYFMKAWFPEGKESSRLTLIKVNPGTAEFWDGSSSKVVMMYNMAKSLASGKRYDEVSNASNRIVDYTDKWI